MVIAVGYSKGHLARSCSESLILTNGCPTLTRSVVVDSDVVGRDATYNDSGLSVTVMVMVMPLM